MKIIRFLSLLLIALSPPILLLSLDRLGTFQSTETADTTPPPELDEPAQTDPELEAGFEALAAAYTEEFEIFKQEILEQWGEFKQVPPSVWLSYERSGQVRRTVDYETGRVEVELLAGRETSANQATAELDRAVLRLMNTTEQEAYAADRVANRVEQRLSDLGGTLLKGEIGNQRLFAPDDLAALSRARNGFIRAAYDDRNSPETDLRAAAKADKYIIRVSFRIPHTIHQKAVKYAAAVAAAARKEKISDELIYAIMETESSFNPMAKSHVPAYGLMQIVPRTAGKDATKYLYGRARILAPSFLYNPDNNIAIGAAYLHVLHYKYMRRIKDEESRIYCAIAAYNTGASNVARAFIDQASFNRATPVINRLSPQEVYDKLRKFLPRKETRRYIEKVSKRMEKYL